MSNKLNQAASLIEEYISEEVKKPREDGYTESDVNIDIDIYFMDNLGYYKQYLAEIKPDIKFRKNDGKT